MSNYSPEIEKEIKIAYDKLQEFNTGIAMCDGVINEPTASIFVRNGFKEQKEKVIKERQEFLDKEVRPNRTRWELGKNA